MKMRDLINLIEESQLNEFEFGGFNDLDNASIDGGEVDGEFNRFRPRNPTGSGSGSKKKGKKGSGAPTKQRDDVYYGDVPGKKSKASNFYIDYIIDSSGSMSPYTSLVNQGFSSFIASQRRDPTPCTLSLTIFDENIVNVFESVDIRRASAKYSDLGGSTALYDAIVKRITRVAKIAGSYDGVAIVVVSDGGDNSSKSTAQDVCALVNRYRKMGWKFLFYGPETNGQEMGRQMCFRKDEIQTFGNSNVGSTFRDADSKIKDFKG